MTHRSMLAKSAYVLLGDPAWLELSVKSYYEHVDTIVASYDSNGRSWSGIDISTDIDRCIQLLRALDSNSKVRFREGSYSDPSAPPMECDTRQRQAALDEAGRHGEWVIQLDTDEVVQAPDLFVESIEIADRSDSDALMFPCIAVDSHSFRRWFLVRTTRRLRTLSDIPGPFAVRAGTRLRFARQTDATAWGISLGRNRNLPSIRRTEAVLHFTWVRSPEEMLRKSRISGHQDLDWDDRLARWHYRCNMPIRGMLRSVVDPSAGTFRLERLPSMFNSRTVEQQVTGGSIGGMSQ